MRTPSQCSLHSQSQAQSSCRVLSSSSIKHRTSTGGRLSCAHGSSNMPAQQQRAGRREELQHQQEPAHSRASSGSANTSQRSKPPAAARAATSFLAAAAAMLLQPAGPVFAAEDLLPDGASAMQHDAQAQLSSILLPSASSLAANLSAAEAPALVGSSGDGLLEGVKSIVESGLNDLSANSMTAVGGPVTSEVLSASTSQAAGDSPDAAAGLMAAQQQQEQQQQHSSPVWCQQAWLAYCEALERSPLPTKMYTGVVGTLLGDLAAQVLSYTSKQQQQQRGKRRSSSSSGSGFEFDAVRAGRLCLYSALIGTPMGHYEYAWLESAVLPDTPLAPAAVAAKVALDQLVQTPFGLALFLAVMKQAETPTALLRPQEVQQELQSKMVPALLANWKLWPAAQLINFTLIPEQQRILYGNIVGICWTCIISNMQHAAAQQDAAATPSTPSSSEAAVVVGSQIRPPPHQQSPPLGGAFSLQLRRRSSSVAA